MANIGEITEFVNNDEWTLEVGTGNYIALEDLIVKVGNLEYRSDTNDSGPNWFLGGGDNFFTFTLTLTSPEYSALNTLTQLDSSGIPTSTSWKIVSEDLAGTTKTMAATGYLRDYVAKKGTKGYAVISCFVRILGRTVTIT
jgi:hypothetical protein